LDSTESEHGSIGRGFSRFGTLNLTSIKISGYCWSKTKLDGIPVTSWCVAVGIDLFFLPSHSPELQPAERLWPLTNEA
jgi:transposase